MNMQLKSIFIGESSNKSTVPNQDANSGQGRVEGDRVLVALSHNKLSGEIPMSFAKMGQLGILDLRGNKLIGKIPTGGQMDSIDPDYFANKNGGLCRVQIQVPCNESLMSGESENIDDLPWFSWGAAGFGYAIGLPSAMLVIGFCGFINPTTKRPQRKHSCHLQS